MSGTETGVSGHGSEIHNLGLIRAAGSSRQTSFVNADLANAGTIQADGIDRLWLGSVRNTPSGRIEARGSDLLFSGDWENRGIVSLTGSNLELHGNFAGSALGRIERDQSSQVVIVGRVENDNDRLEISADTGSILLSGTVAGGTVSQRDGETLRFGGDVSPFHIPTLIFARFEEPLDLTSGGPGTAVQLLNGSSIPGAILGAPMARLDWDQGGRMDEGSLRLLGEESRVNLRLMTIGPAAPIEMSGSGARITGLPGVASSLVNLGTISADGEGRSGTQTIDPGSFSNQGLVEARGGGRLRIGGGQTAIENVRAGRLEGGRWAVFDDGTLTLGGASFSVNAADVLLSGPASRFFSSLRENSASGTLRLADRHRFVASSAFRNDGLLELRDATLASPHVVGTGSIRGSGTLEGHLEFDGSLLPGGDGTIGVLSITGGLALGEASLLSVELGAGGDEPEFDLIEAAAEIVLGGRLFASLLPPFEDQIDPRDSFEILRSAVGIRGSFANVASGERLNVGPGRMLLSIEPTRVLLSAFAPELDSLLLVGLSLVTLIGLRRRGRRP
jgi:hypothetical protein